VANATLSRAGRLVTQREADAAIAEVDGIDQYELVQPLPIRSRYAA